MIKISSIGTYIPQRKISNLSLMNKFNFDENFIKNKIGVLERSIKSPEQKSSDLCIKAFENLLTKVDLDTNKIDCCVVITQNPDLNIPHTSALLHGSLKLPENCSCFDISLGCSGYVYGLSIVTAFMQANQLKNGLLFTADPYSDIIDPNDKSTVLIFGDAATVSLLQNQKNGLAAINYNFGSRGIDYKSLINKDKLYMNGRAVFSFSASVIPKSIEKLLVDNHIDKAEVNQWYFNQGSKYIVDTITKRLNLNPDKVVFDMYNYGNTVSSSIPILLNKNFPYLKAKEKIVMSGFGVGLSWASAIFEMKKDN